MLCIYFNFDIVFVGVRGGPCAPMDMECPPDLDEDLVGGSVSPPSSSSEADDDILFPSNLFCKINDELFVYSPPKTDRRLENPIAKKNV